MRLANLDGRATVLIDETTGVDVATASDGRFGPALSAVYGAWEEFRAWAAEPAVIDAAPRVAIAREQLGSPSPAPRQVFAIGLNYGAHATEAAIEPSEGMPPVFSKWQSSLAGPETTVVLPPGGNTDWEVELVVVVGREARDIDADEAWDVVAGLSVGQDITERIAQMTGPVPQFGLAKSFPGFSPIGPWLVTIDELSDPDDLELGCSLDGETMQLGRTKDLIYSVPRLLANLSQKVELYPGDVVFTGTPGGVGLFRSPQRFIQPGEELVSWVEGIGSIRQSFVAR
jgi:2-keto-4-pentenoate hydratase/2-oxohepta-3-ene-1,7-dioic acid hydratase in catechol pathway